jgi:hypothetical protein
VLISQKSIFKYPILLLIIFFSLIKSVFAGTYGIAINRFIKFVQVMVVVNLLGEGHINIKLEPNSRIHWRKILHSEKAVK